MSEFGNPSAESGAPQAATPAPAEPPAILPANALKALAHPLRMRMFTYLNDHGSATATVLAQELDESTGQTSYHLRQLERHGIITEDTERSRGRERWWKPVGYRADYEDPEYDADAQAALSSWAVHQVQHQTNLLLNWIGGLQHSKDDWADGSVISSSTLDLTLPQLKALTEEILDTISRHQAAAKKASPDADPSLARTVRIQLNAFPLPRADA